MTINTIISKDKYTSISLHKIEATLFVIVQIFCNPCKKMFMSSLLIAGMFSLEYFLVQLYQQKMFPFSTNHEMFPYFEWRIIKVACKFLRLGIITWVISLFSPQFSWGIFSSVVHLHQYRGSKNMMAHNCF